MIALLYKLLDKYNLTFNGSHNPSRISLNSNNGKEFLKAIKLKDSALRQHIQSNVDLIQAPYLLRDVIIHRESLRGLKMESEGWAANLVFVNEEFVECLKRLGDRNEKYREITNFGVYSHSFLSPYMFAKKIASLLFTFCNEYLRLLGYGDWNEQLKQAQNDSFNRTFSLFKEDNLGF
jgi:hypothetical protein